MNRSTGVGAASMALAQIRGLHRDYQIGPETVHALAGIDLDIGRGERIAIVGVSGSGKSTLLQLLGGLDRPSAGRIDVDGHALAELDHDALAHYRRHTVAFVFQSFHLIPSLSAQRNVEVALTFQGIYGDERRQRARDALDRVGLADRARHRPGQLSGGEQQRVAIARAIVGKPAMLLADEPTGNLDAKNADTVHALLGDVAAAESRTIVIVTHDEARARRFASRIIRLENGVIVGEEAA